MSFEDSREKAKEFGTAAIAAMSRYDVALTPMNYRIWYAYMSGRDKDLVRSLDVLIGNQVEFTPKKNREIYDRFFDAEDTAGHLCDNSTRLESIASEILEQLHQTNTDQDAYCDKMASLSGMIGAAPDARRLAELVQDVLAETKDIVVKSQQLKLRLSESSGEVAELRRHLEEVREEALTDGLTGIGNRKFLDLRLLEEVKSAMESGESLCVVLADIDHFKKFNDTYGHRIGDEVLRLAGRVLKDSVKGQDTPARYGGEEFCIILPRTSLTNAVNLAEQIRRTLETRELKSTTTSRSYGRISMSLGVSLYRPGEAIDDFVSRADAALYRAKRDGRNRVESEEPGSESLSLAS